MSKIQTKWQIQEEKTDEREVNLTITKQEIAFRGL